MQKSTLAHRPSSTFDDRRADRIRNLAHNRPSLPPAKDEGLVFGRAARLKAMSSTQIDEETARLMFAERHTGETGLETYD